MAKVITRFAPSPTGLLHIGAARTALFGWLYAQRTGGQFILRIEDTDKKREVPEATDNIKKSLKWLGLDWQDEFLQSERLDIYQKHAKQLFEQGWAYADPYTPDEVEKFREEAKKSGQPFLYRNFRPENPPAWNGKQPLRLLIKEPEPQQWTDVVRGQLSAGAEALDDIVLMKSDGYPTYNFAHVVDDHLMKITHVLRGEEFIASMPNFLAIYGAFGWQPPAYATVPAILGKNGRKKLSKRDGDAAVLDYRKGGYLPEALVNYLALLGWNEGQGSTQEFYTADELKQKFTLERIQKSPAVFDLNRLKWVNAHYIRKLPVGDFQKAAKTFLQPKFQKLPKERLELLLKSIQERVHTLQELEILPTYILEPPEFSESKAREKTSEFEQASKGLTLKDWLNEVIDVLKQGGSSDSEALQSALSDRVAAHPEVAPGTLWSILRDLLTDSDKTPPIGELVVNEIGISEAIARLERVQKIL